MAGRAKIVRGKSAGRGKGNAKLTKGNVRRKSPATKSAFARMVEALPISEAFIDRAVTVSMVGLVSVAALGLAWYSGLPGYVGTEIAQSIGRAGFAVKRVEVTGLERMDRLTVYAIALDQHSMAMPLVDLEKVRGQLLRFGWVEDARVSRRLPDTLVVDIVERKPTAIWQNNKKLTLIDKKGVVLERINASAMPDLPLVIGDKANREAVALNELLDRTPSLKPVLTSATWVGNRRWDLQFQSGEVLALPEGKDKAAAAITNFARIEGVERLLGRGFVRFDMRDSTKMVVRIQRTVKSADPKDRDEKAGDEKANGSKPSSGTKGEQG
jgi:cell division protein FtsQ